MNLRLPRALVALVLIASAPLAGAAESAPSTHAKGPTALHVSHGQEINVSDYFVPGKTTILDFYSEYCPPCRALSPHLETLHEKRADIAVVKVDINRPGVRGIDWQSPVARQYHLESIPYLMVVSPKGQVEAEGDQAYEKVASWIEAAEGP